MWKYDTGLKTDMSLVNISNRKYPFWSEIAAILDIQVRGWGKVWMLWKFWGWSLRLRGWGVGGGLVGGIFWDRCYWRIPAAISGRRKSHKLLVASIWKYCNLLLKSCKLSCLLLTKSFQKNWLEIIVNGTQLFESFQRKISRSNRTS